MVGRKPKSKAELTIQIRKEKDGLYAMAMDLYLLEHCDPMKKEGKSYMVVCEEITRAHYEKTGRLIELSTSTLQRLVKGGTPKSKSNAQKSWLKEEESELLVSFIIDLAERGFPLKVKEIKRHAEDILQARLGDAFPSTGLGKHWAERFICKHSDRLKKYLSRGLDKRRARSVNATTHDAWFSILGKTIQDYNIEPDCTYGSDEVGFLLRSLDRCNVVGPVKQKFQYKCGTENRENATVLCTICGDGSALPPLVIFKGRHYFAHWGKHNSQNFM